MADLSGGAAPAPCIRPAKTVGDAARLAKSGTRLFVTDIERWEEFGRAHSAFFGEHRPATTMVEVAKLIDGRMLVEIEADACDDARL